MRVQPKASSSGFSNGVPQTRQITAEQSPHTRGSSTARAQFGHQSFPESGVECDDSGCGGVGSGGWGCVGIPDPA
ncbi:MAG TPA: hypothetical protein VM554_03860 [Acidisarcina sp.]|nr:hypothetical protein [Acidisarcina sp.]